MSQCDRCGQETNATIMSKFNSDTLCMQCKQDERLAPGYKYADEREVEAVRAGNYNFSGVGLSTVDAAFLTALRRKRKGGGQ